MRLYSRLISFNQLLVFVRVLKYLSAIDRIQVLHSTIWLAKDDIMSYFVLLLCIFMGFVLLANFNFGHSIYELSSIPRAMMSCIFTMLGQVDTVEQMLQEDRVMAIVFYVPLMIIITFILLKMFVAILCLSYFTCD